MAICYLSTRLFSPFRLKIQSFSSSTNTQLKKISLNAEKVFTHLKKSGQTPEKTLNLVKPQLDVTCVTEILSRCCVNLNEPLLGLRFFIWAGAQPKYRHSQYMYSLACKLLDIERMPNMIMDVFEVYSVEKCPTNVKVFRVVLNLCKEARFANEALWVLRKMGEFSCRPDTTMFNVVIGLFCERGEVDVAMGLMKEMEESDLVPDMITYMSLLKAFCNVGRLEDACRLFKVIRSYSCVPNLVAFSVLLDGICRFGSWEKALELLGEMEKDGGECTPNVITYTSVIQRFCEKGKSVEALSVLERMKDCQCSPNRVTVSVLIKGLCDEGHFDEAYKLVDKIALEGHVSSSECYSSLIISLLRVKRLEEAHKRFKWMLNNDVRPDGLACSMLLRDLCSEGEFLVAFYLYENVEKIGCVSTMDSDVFSILLVGLCQQNHKNEVAKLACLMVEKGLCIKDPYERAMNEFAKGFQDIKTLAKLCNLQ